MADISIPRVQSLLSATTIGRELLYEATVTSTMDVARQRAEAGAPEGLTVIANEQTAGRGRLRRGWTSPPNVNLYLTVVFRPPNTTILAQLAMLCPLAVCETATELGLSGVGIKWPNDVLHHGRKLAGILLQVGSSGNNAHYAIAGIGLNVNMDPREHPETAAVATSLRAALGQQVEREAVLAALLNALDLRYRDALAGLSPYRAWRERLIGLGEKARVDLGGRIIEGIALDVDHDGTLQLQQPDGSIERVAAGDLILGG